MSAVIKQARVRASKPKTRTGCRTCKARHVKCDEDRPSCRRCQVAGRECAGYANSPDRRAPYALLLPKPSQTRQIIKQIALNAPLAIDAFESMNLEFFYTYTAKGLPGSDLGLPWSSIILSAGSTEPTINRAVSALGSLHRALEGSSSTATVGSDVFVHPYEQYHKAIVALRRYIDRTPEVGIAVARETALTATLLLFCFEVLCGQDELAVKHLEAAFGMLAKTHQKQASQYSQGSATLVLTPSQATAMNALTQVFLRLASDWLVSGLFHYEGKIWPLQAVCEGSIPSHFQSLGDASLHLDALCSEVAQYDDCLVQKSTELYDSEQKAHGQNVHECAKFAWIFAVSRMVYKDTVSPLDDKFDKTLIELERWRAAFSPFIEADTRSMPILLLEVQFLQAWLQLQLLRDYDNTRCDELLAYFERVIDIAETYIDQQAFIAPNGRNVDRNLPNISQLGNNLASCVSLVVEKCRDSKTRRRGIQILSFVEFCGIFDMPYLVAYCRHLVDTEEARARMFNPEAVDALKCQDVPAKARVREAMFCDCESDGDGDQFFYKRNHGRLIYAFENDNGVLELGESRFLVPRKGTTGRRAPVS